MPLRTAPTHLRNPTQPATQLVVLLLVLGCTGLPAQTAKRARPAGSGVPAAALPVARAQPNYASQTAMALSAATPMALPASPHSGAAAHPARATPNQPVNHATPGTELDPRVFRVDPRDEVVIVAPLTPPPLDSGSRRNPASSSPPARRSSAIPPAAVTKIIVEPAPPADPETPASAPTIRVNVRPQAVEVDDLTLPTVAEPEWEASKPSRKRGGSSKMLREGTVATLQPKDLAEYNRQPARVKAVIREALGLTSMGLGYKFGSADPSRGGMDCSGAVFSALKSAGMQSPPRDSFSQYQWLVKHRKFHAAGGGFRRFDQDKVKPGDLLFWVNTYKTNRNPPVTHVAIYLGKEKRTGRHVMMHAGGGRRYNGKSRRGVTVANFDYPDRIGVRGGKGSFIGYGSIPGVR